MKLYHRKEDGLCIVSAVGNLVLTETNKLKNYVQPLIEDPAVTNVLINCQGIEIIDSRGIGLLAAILKDMEELEKGFLLSDLNNNCFSVLESLQLHTIMKIFSKEEDAIKSIKRH